MEVVNKMQNGYYVYRFKNEDGIIIYVGKTVNLENRFKNHEHMTEDVKIIEYIETHKTPRTDLHFDIQASGYDIKTEAQKLQEIYIDLWNKN